MANRYDAIVIGAGHNGLVTAAYLGRAGLRTLVLERRDRVGGALATTDLGAARVPAAAHTVGRLRSSVVRDLGLTGHGFVPITPAVRVFAPQPDGRSVTLWGDPARTAEGLRGLSAPDADAYVEFDKRMRAVASFLAYLQVATPPNLKTPSLKDAQSGLGLGRALRGMGSRGRREAIRLLPMAVADLVGEVFESDAIRGALAVRGVQYTSTGPWSSGTAAVFLNDSAGNDGGAAGQTTFARGGPGALAEALASAVRTFRGDIRTGADVERVLVDGDRVRGVALLGGEEVDASIVVSGADPKRTLLGLLDPVTLGPSLAWRARNYRTPGVTAKVNFVLSGLPSFAADGGDDPEHLSGRILIAPGIDYLERGFDAAKYGRVSEAPFLEATIPTLADPTLAPDGTHVMSVILQWAPYTLRESDLGKGAERPGRPRPEDARVVRARHRRPRRRERDPVAGRPRARLRPDGGSRPPRRGDARPVLRVAAAARARAIPDAGPRHVPVRLGRAPRRRRHRWSRRERRARDPGRPEGAGRAHTGREDRDHLIPEPPFS